MRRLLVTLTALSIVVASPSLADAQRRRARGGPPAPAQVDASEQASAPVDASERASAPVDASEQASAPVDASEQATEPLLDEEARALFLAGRAAFDAGRYEHALDYFSRAYALSGRPGLLFDIGSASERLRRDPQALHAYEAYLEAFPEAPNREYAESRITFLEEQIRVASVRERARAELDPGSASRPAPERAPAPAPAGPEPPSALALGATDVRETERPPGGVDLTREWWFWTLIGVAVVGAGAGIAAGVLASEGSGSDAPVQGDFGPGGIIIALESL